MHVVEFEVDDLLEVALEIAEKDPELQLPQHRIIQEHLNELEREKSDWSRIS